MGRRRHWMVTLSLLAGCFTDNGGAASVTGASTSTATTGDPGVTSGGPGTTSEDSSATGSTCAGTCGGPGDPTTPGETGDLTTGGPTGDTTGETTTGGARPMLVPGLNLFVEGAFALATGRFDEDGRADLVVTSNNLLNSNVYVFHGPGMGPLDAFDTVKGNAVVAPDIDGDGDSDIVVGQPGSPAQVHVFEWDAGVKIGPVIPLPDSCSTPRAFALGHLNGDMLDDLVIACDTAGLVILPGVNNGVFGLPLQMATGGAAVGVALADTNGDGNNDVLYLDSGNDGLVVVRGTGVLDIGANKSSAFKAEEPIALAVGRLNGDAILDILVATGKSTCPTFLGSPDAPIAGPIYVCGPAVRDVQLADLDGDGLDDVVTVHNEELRVGFGLGDGTFFGPDLYKVGQAPARLAIGDYDGDAHLDVAVTGTNALMLFLQVQ